MGWWVSPKCGPHCARRRGVIGSVARAPPQRALCSKLGSPEESRGSTSLALSLNPFPFLEAGAAPGPRSHSPSAGAGSQAGGGGLLCAEAAGPYGLCAEPRPGHLGRPEAGAGAGGHGRGDAGSPRGPSPQARGKVLSWRGFGTRRKLSPRKGRGSQAPLISSVTP